MAQGEIESLIHVKTPHISWIQAESSMQEAITIKCYGNVHSRVKLKTIRMTYNLLKVTIKKLMMLNFVDGHFSISISNDRCLHETDQ